MELGRYGCPYPSALTHGLTADEGSRRLGSGERPARCGPQGVAESDRRARSSCRWPQTEQSIARQLSAATVVDAGQVHDADAWLRGRDLRYPSPCPQLHAANGVKLAHVPEPGRACSRPHPATELRASGGDVVEASTSLAFPARLEDAFFFQAGENSASVRDAQSREVGGFGAGDSPSFICPVGQLGFAAFGRC